MIVWGDAEGAYFVFSESHGRASGGDAFEHGESLAAEGVLSRSTRFSRRRACASFAPPSQRMEAMPSLASARMASEERVARRHLLLFLVLVLVLVERGLAQK